MRSKVSVEVSGILEADELGRMISSARFDAITINNAHGHLSIYAEHGFMAGS